MRCLQWIVTLFITVWLCCCFFILVNFTYKMYLDIKDNELNRNYIGYKLDSKLEEKIIMAIKNKETINLSEIVKENFDKIIIYSNYQALENEAEKRTPLMRSYIKNFPKSGYSYVILLDKNNIAVKSIVLDKRYDISSGITYKEYSRKEAVFNFDETINSDGGKYYELK